MRTDEVLRHRLLLVLIVLGAGTLVSAGFLFRSTGDESPRPRLTAFALGPSRVELDWTSSGSPARYRVIRNGVVVAETARTSFTDSRVRQGAPYHYRLAVLNDRGRVIDSLAAPTVRAPTKGSMPVYPLKAGPGNRYLVDQRNVPFMVVGDSPQALTSNIPVTDARAFLADRRAAGYNAMWVNLLCIVCTSLAGGRTDGTTYDGINPFSTPGDMSTPNEAYFARADRVLRLAQKDGMLVFLNPIEAAGWLDVLRKNSIATAYGYGRFLGKRYGKFTNIIWFHGNDFQTWRTRSDTLRVQAVARGIRAEAPKQLQTVELNYLVSSSLDDPTWRRLIAIDSVYTYAPTYAELLKAYNRPRRLPRVMVEANYEFEAWHYATDLETLRRQEYWSMLSGASGQFYGNKYTWQFSSGWKSHVDTPGSRQMILASNFFRAIPWFDLVPDQRHTLLTAGYGTFADSGPINPNDYATAAGTSDRKLAIVYVPTVRPVTVDMAKLKGRVLARWYDPTNGRYTRVSGPLLSNSGERRFTPPGKNGDGDGDWVLTLATR